MKWKLLLTLPLYLLLLMPITSNAYYAMPEKYDSSGKEIKKPIASKVEKIGKTFKPANDPIYDTGKNPVADNSVKKFSKTKKIVKGGAVVKTAHHVLKHKWLYAGGALVAYGAYQYSQSDINRRENIDDVIDKHFYADDWRSEKKSKLVPILYKKIFNAKSGTQHLVVNDIQQSLIYHMAKYDGESLGKLANSILVSLDIMNNDVMMQTNFEIKERNDAKALIELNIDNIDRTRKRTKCERGSPEREYIKLNSSFSTNGINTLSEFDVGHYGIQVNINNNNNYSVKKYNIFKSPNDPSRKNYDFEKDHIPSKKAVALYLAKRDNLGVLHSRPYSKNIENNAISVVMYKSIHKRGRTNGRKNETISKKDATNLRQAIFDDFEDYYLLAAIDKRNDSSFNANWIKALILTYIENEAMCLFI